VEFFGISLNGNEGKGMQEKQITSDKCDTRPGVRKITIVRYTSPSPAPSFPCVSLLLSPLLSFNIYRAPIATTIVKVQNKLQSFMTEKYW
jgi:hypothetical protein